jgi:hypothetical protein
MAPKRNSKRKPKGPPKPPTVAAAAKPTGVKKARRTRQAANTGGNQATSNIATRGSGRALVPEIAANPSLFNLGNPEQRARDPGASQTPGNGTMKKATKKTTTKTTGTKKKPAPAAAPAPVAQPLQPAQPQPDTVEPEHDGERTDNEPVPADDAAADDLTADQEAEKEAVEVEQAIHDASAARERAEKEQAAKEAVAKKKKEAAEKEKATKQKALQEEQAKQKALQQDQIARRLEAARLQAVEDAAREKAAKEKVAAEEAAREKAAQEKAAREKAAREEAVRERLAAEETTRQKATPDKATEEQRAAEDLARQRAAEEKAAKEKAAAEVKAAEEKEQAAKAKATQDEAAQTKAAEDEAAKAKATALRNKKAAHDFAEFRKREEAEKMEQVRQAQEQKDREKEELLAKEAAGFKRPGMKRAAEPKPDDANKKAKTDDDDCKPSCKRFTETVSLAKFKFGKTASKSPDGPVKLGSHLNLDTIFQALASVTEAINDKCAANKKAKLFGLFHPRSLVDFDLAGHPVVLQRHDALVPIDRSAGKRTHFSLIVLVQTSSQQYGGRDLFAMHHYDSDPSLRAAFHNTIVRSTVRKQILSAGWAGSGKGDVETPLGQSENRECCDRLSGPGQEWTSGVHAILNGWVCALNFKHNKDALVSKQGFYEKAVDLINLALRNFVSSQMIIDFFNCYDYIESKDPLALLRDGRERRTFKDSNNFETFAKLDTHIMKLLGRKPNYDLARQTKKPPTPTLGPKTPTSASTDRGRHLPPTAINSILDGAAGLLKRKGDDVKPKETLANDDGYDSARSEDSVFEEEKDALEEEEEKKPEAPNVPTDWEGKPITEGSKAAAEAAGAARLERILQLQRERVERVEREAAQEESAVADDPDNDSLFGGDFGDLEGSYPEEAPAPTSAPQGNNAQNDFDEDLYGASPPRHTQLQLELHPTIAEDDNDDDEALYGIISSPRNATRASPPPTGSVFPPNPPPPTPHDPYAVTSTPFLQPNMYYPPPPQPVANTPSLLLTSATSRLPPGPPPPSQKSNSGTFRHPSISSASDVSSKVLSSHTAEGGIRYPSIPSASNDNSNQPVKPRTFVNPNPKVNPNPNGTFRVPDTPSNSIEPVKPVKPRTFINPNPTGTYEAPDTPSSASESNGENAAGGQEDSSGQANADQNTTTTQNADGQNSSAAQATVTQSTITQTAAERSSAPQSNANQTPTTQESAAQTAEAAMEEEAWAASGWNDAGGYSPSLKAAFAENELPWNLNPHNGHGMTQIGYYDPTAGFKTAQESQVDAVGNGDVDGHGAEVEDGDEYEIYYNYDVHDSAL